MDYDLPDILKLRRKSLEHDYIKLFAKKHNSTHLGTKLDETVKRIFVLFKKNDTDLADEPDLYGIELHELFFDIDSETGVNMYEDHLCCISYINEHEDPISYCLFVQEKSN